MSFFDSLGTSASALTAQRLRMDTIANNLANANSTHGPDGAKGAYRRQMAIFESRAVYRQNIEDRAQKTPMGVHAKQVIEDQSPFRLVYEPGHPDANPDGYVAYPNVNTVQEMTDMISATRSYEANVTIINAVKGMAARRWRSSRCCPSPAKSARSSCPSCRPSPRVPTRPRRAASAACSTSCKPSPSSAGDHRKACPPRWKSARPCSCPTRAWRRPEAFRGVPGRRRSRRPQGPGPEGPQGHRRQADPDPFMFLQPLQNGVGETNRLMGQSDKLANEAAVGGDVDLHDVMISAEKASVALQLTLQVRNKLVEAYQEVMRMQV